MVSNQIINEVILRDKGFEKTNKKFAALKKNISGVARSSVGFSKIQSTMGSINMQIDNQNKKIKQSILNTTKLGRAWEQSKMGVLGFNGALLSTLFFGMELKRIFGGALKSIFEGYGKILGEGTRFNKQMTKLNASWQFFKFQLADALASSTVFQTMVAGAVQLLNAVGQLPEPIRQAMGWFLVIGAIAGSVLFIIGIWALGIAGVIDLLSSMGVTAKGTKSKVGLIGKAIKALFLPADKVLGKFKTMQNLAKTFSFKNIKTQIGNFFKGMKIGNVKSFSGLITKIKAIFTGLFSSLGGKLSKLWSSLQAVFKNGWKAASKGFLKGALTGIKGLVKKIPIIGWIIIAIETIFKSVEDFMSSQTSTWLGTVISTISSVIIRAIEAIITFFTSLIDVIVNVISWIIERVSSLLGFDINIPSLDLTGITNDIADKLVNSVDDAAAWVEEKMGVGKYKEKFNTPDFTPLKENIENAGMSSQQGPVSQENVTNIYLNDDLNASFQTEQDDPTSRFLEELGLGSNKSGVTR